MVGNKFKLFFKSLVGQIKSQWHYEIPFILKFIFNVLLLFYFLFLTS